MAALTEGGIRNAAFVHYPPAIRQGRVDDEFITVMDVPPTPLEIAGTEHPGTPPGGEAPPWRLYDLSADPGETTDLAARHPELTAELAGIWERDWR